MTSSTLFIFKINFYHNHNQNKGMLCKLRPIARQISALNLRIIKNNRLLHSSSQLYSDEVENAKKAAETGNQNDSTVFDKIISKEIPIKLLYEDEKCLAFDDIAPQAPVHFLVIPKRRINMIENATENDDNVSFSFDLNI